MARSWCASLFARSVTSSKRRTAVLKMETLEDRTVPATLLTVGTLANIIDSPVVSVTGGGTTLESTTEGDDFRSFRLMRTGDTSAALTVSVAVGGSASSGDYFVSGVGGGSYDAVAGTVTFDAGVSLVSVVIGPVQDGDSAEGDETIDFSVVEGDAYDVAADHATATITIAANGLLVTNVNESGPGSLVQAVANANSFAGADTITFDPTAFATRKTIFVRGTMSFTQQGMDNRTTIVAPAVGVSLGSTSRLFVVNENVHVRMIGVTVDSAGALNKDGGAFGNGGVLTLEGVTISGAMSASGGAIYNVGTLTIADSTLVNNFTTGAGGALFNQGGTVTLTNVTISGNRASGGGGGIHATGAGSVTLNNVTVTNNRSDVDEAGGEFGGGIGVDDTTVTVNNSIVAGNFRGNGTTSDNVAGPIGRNFSLIDGDARLGPLANNGGPTRTHALLAGSPALNAGDPSLTTPTSDQRGQPRVQGGRVDLGAFEAAVTFRIDDGTDNSSGQVKDGGQHSMIRRVVLPLAGPLSVANGFQFKFRTGAAGINVGGVTLSLVRLQGELPFKIKGTYRVDNGGAASIELSFKRQVSVNPLQYRDSLPDGDYRLRIADTTIEFFRMLGDVNGDRTVNGIDEAAFNAAFGTNPQVGNYRSYFDSNSNLRIAGGDRQRFRKRLGTSLPEVY